MINIHENNKAVKYYTIPEVAKKLDTTTINVYYHKSKGHFRYIIASGRYFVSEHEVKRLQEAMTRTNYWRRKKKGL